MTEGALPAIPDTLGVPGLLRSMRPDRSVLDCTLALSFNGRGDRWLGSASRSQRMLERDVEHLVDPLDRTDLQ